MNHPTLAALLALSLPLTLVGCNRANPDTTTEPHPSDTPPNLVPMPVATNTPSALVPSMPPVPNGVPVPSDSSKVTLDSTATNSTPASTPDQSSKLDNSTPTTPTSDAPKTNMP